jgi:hypothetical protein
VDGPPEERPADRTPGAAGADDRPILILELQDGFNLAGDLTVPVVGAAPVTVELSPAKFRVLLALRDAMRADVANPAVREHRRGWCSPRRVSQLIDEQLAWKTFLRDKTIRSYVSSISRLVQKEAAAKGATEPPQIFSRRRRGGIRLDYPLLVIDGTGAVPP